MSSDPLRPFLNLAAGLVIGFLVAWGLFERFSAKPASSSVLAEPAPTALSSQVAVTATPKPADENVVAEGVGSTSASARQTPGGQQNGLPLGVSRGALNYDKGLYQRYPGLKPPLVNTDGRDLSPEATQQLQAAPTLLPNPTPVPGASVGPFPLVIPNSQVDQSPSPLPTP
jgi:hypothetical protein